MEEVSRAEVRVLVDERALPGYRGEYGLSLYIATDKWRALFDTGQSAETVAHNASLAGIKLSQLDFVVLSHEHYDHVGGIAAVAAEVKGLPVYVPAGVNWRLERTIEEAGLKPVRTLTGREVAPGAFVTTQQYGPPYEHSMLINVHGSPALLLGCSHPGPSKMVAKATADLGLTISTLIGGLHLAWSPESTIRTQVEAIKSLGVSRLIPLHCSGDLVMEVARRAGIEVRRALAGEAMIL